MSTGESTGEAEQVETSRRRLLADIRPLRESPAFRRLWLGSLVSTIGGQLTQFALILQVFQLTHSSAAVGAISLVALGPGLVAGLFGGTFADALDRRTLVIVASLCLTGVSALLTMQAFLTLNKLWLIYLLVGAQALLVAVNSPVRQTFLAQLLPREQLAAGSALNMSSFQASMLAGPALGGLITTTLGLRACYLIDVFTFAAALYGLARLPKMPPSGEIDRPGVRSILAGLRFVRGKPVLVGAMVADLNAMVFGLPIAVFPAINAAHFGGSAQTLGLLTTAVGAGGVVGSLLSGPIGHVRRPGRLMLVLIGLWGLGIAGFGVTRIYWLALLLLAFCGALDNTSVVVRNTLVQQVTPDRLRGRINAVNFVVGYGGPQLGSAEAGLVGSLVSPAASVISGGLLTVFGVLVLGALIPSLRRYDITAERSPAAR